jgi:arginyl-tRNA synthetase
MLFESQLRADIVTAMQQLYAIDVNPDTVVLNPTRKEFEGDITLVVFNLAKTARKSPDQLGEEIGGWLRDHASEVSKYNVVKGFLNILIKTEAWSNVFAEVAVDRNYGKATIESNIALHPWSHTE